VSNNQFSRDFPLLTSQPVRERSPTIPVVKSVTAVTEPITCRYWQRINTSLSLFALIIGINKYKNANMTTLKGAVADADLIQDYLEGHLNVPKSHIRNLRDVEATRAAIVSAFHALRADPRIKNGDPILIYYAGHGGETNPPNGWDAGGADKKIQMLLPHDYGTDINNAEVHGIPDRTISVLINELAKEKGDNIVRPMSQSKISISDRGTDCYI